MRNNSKSTTRDFVKNLRSDDRKDLFGILGILKEYNLDVVARGSSVGRESKQSYHDVDLLISGNREEYKRAFLRFEAFKYMPYTGAMGPYVGEPEIEDRFKIRNFDISYSPKLQNEDIEQVYLLRRH